MTTLDAIDRRILNRLQLDARVTNSALSKEVGLSESACLRRVKLLENSGVILGYSAIIAGRDSESATFAIVQIQLERQSEEYLAKFEAAMRNHAEIREWYLMTGAGDYWVRVQISGIEDFANFHREVLARLPGVSRITTSFAMRRTGKVR